MLFIERAEIKDIQFIIETVIQAEKSGTDKIITCRLFNISETEYRRVLYEILASDILGYELALSNFKIVFDASRPVAAYAMWCEQSSGMSSDFLRMNAYTMFLKKESIEYFRKGPLKLVKEIEFTRQPMTIQFESLYIIKEYRGQSIARMLTDAHLEDVKQAYPHISKIQTQQIKQNELALRTHFKLGYTIADEKSSQSPEILKYYPGETKVLLEKTIEL